MQAARDAANESVSIIAFDGILRAESTLARCTNTVTGTAGRTASCEVQNEFENRGNPRTSSVAFKSRLISLLNLDVQRPGWC